MASGAVKPGAKGEVFAEAFGLFGESDEGLLGGVFCEGGVGEGAPGDGEDKAPMPVHEEREGVFIARFSEAAQEV